MKCEPSSLGRACICTFAASDPASFSVSANEPNCSPLENLAKFPERFVQLDLLRRWDTRIRHHPIGDEVALEKPLGEPERLRPREKQFLSLLNFFLPLRVEFVHSVRVRKN